MRALAAVVGALVLFVVVVTGIVAVFRASPPIGLLFVLALVWALWELLGSVDQLFDGHEGP